MSSSILEVKSELAEQNESDQLTWEQEIAGLLSMLSETQGDLLNLLAEKRDLLLASDSEGLATIAEREEEIAARLGACHDRRGELLEKAAEEGLPSDSIRSLAAALPQQESDPSLTPRIEDARLQARLLQHQSLTNWVLVQRTILHLSQILEIIATGGRPQPTYGKGSSSLSSGSLIDQAI